MTGGFPHAVAAEQDTGLVAPGVYEIYRTAVISQIKRAGYREGPFREVITWAAAGRLGQEFSWNSLASETEVGAKDTARRYIEDAEQLFLWHVLQRSQNAATLRPALKSPKKLYPVDPFTWHMLSSWVDGDSDPWSTSLLRLADPTARGGLVEGVVADHLIRGYAPFAFYHRTTGGEEEIDLVVERAKAPGRIEIKYRRRVTRVHENHLAKYGGGLVITSDDLAYDATRAVARIPLYALLAGYADPITLYPSRG
jgi:predicted AAA+ superfamily ATPase